MIASFLRKYFPLILVGLAILSAVPGYIIYYRDNSISFDITDLAYDVFQLFPINSSFEPTRVNLLLNVARFLAPLSLATVLIQGFVRLFSLRFREQEIRKFRNHVIVAGDSENNRKLARNLKSEEKQYVLLTADPENAPQALPDDDLFVLTIPQYDIHALKKAGIKKAKYLIISFANDTDALLLASRLSESLSREEITHQPDILVLFNNPAWAEYCNDLGITWQVSNGFKPDSQVKFRFLNHTDAAVRRVMLQHAPDIYCRVDQPDSNHPGISIVGWNLVCERLLLNLARNSHYLNHKMLQVHLFADDLATFTEFKARYQLDKVIRINEHTYAELAGAEHQVPVVYITEQSDEKLLLILAEIRRSAALSGATRIVLSDRSDSIAGLIRESGHLFTDLSAESTQFNTLVDESIDRLAQIIHQEYLNSLPSVNPEIPTHRSWEQLPDEIRNRNRAQADHLWVKLRSLNAEMVPLHEAGETIDITTDPRFEALSKAEHHRWNAYMLTTGWRPGSERDEQRKIHPDIIPYEELTEQKRIYDRNTLKNIDILARAMDCKIICRKK